jgi:hypothetical protein
VNDIENSSLFAADISEISATFLSPVLSGIPGAFSLKYRTIFLLLYFDLQVGKITDL